MPAFFIFKLLPLNAAVFLVLMPVSSVISSRSVHCQVHTYIFLYFSLSKKKLSFFSKKYTPLDNYVLHIYLWGELYVINNWSLNYFRQHVFRTSENILNFRSSQESIIPVSCSDMKIDKHAILKPVAEDVLPQMWATP